MRGRPDVGVLYRGIGGVQRRTGWREMPSFRGFGKSAAEGISSAAISGLEREAVLRSLAAITKGCGR